MHAIAVMFYARASVTPKRVRRSLCTQKVLATVRQTARATPGAPRTARPSKCAISQSKHEPEAACPYIHNRRKALHGLGQLIQKAASYAGRTDRRNGGHAIGQHHRAAESWREPLLQGGARKRRYPCCKCTDPRRLKALARSTQELLATSPQILHAAQLLPGRPAT